MDTHTPTNEAWFNKPYKCEDVAENVDLHVLVSDPQTVTYQFKSTNQEPNDPSVKTNLHYGYDAIDDQDGWFFTVETGGKYFLAQFDPA